MATRLDEIVATKRAEVARRKATRSLSDLHRAAAAQQPPRGFRAALEAAPDHALIAEIKRASPSKGLIRDDFCPPAHARAYAVGGAACLSILTDEPYFQGHDDYLVQARAACALPCLRKDFTVDPWQAAEAAALGADAILLIVAALDDAVLAECEAAALELGLDVLVEVHDTAELERSWKLRSRLIGINNRDLRDFSVDLDRTLDLMEFMPADVTAVAESGLRTKADLDGLAAAGVRAFLVGESLMRQDDVEAATRKLLTGN